VEINALQRAATVVVHKPLQEGFGITVSEAMWKGKPVVASEAGGLPAQIIEGVTGFLVRSEEGAAFRIRHLLNNPGVMQRMGGAGREHVRRNFMITRHLIDQLTLLNLYTGNPA
jgi:trehalose synthase